MIAPYMTNIDMKPIEGFLQCSTPQAWIDCALGNQELLLIDHCNCEKKAASTALSLMYKYVEHTDLLMKMSKLAREELRHFEQVLKIMSRRNITYQVVSASRYAQGLMGMVRKQEPFLLIDKLIVGAYIEARSCERFYRLAPYLDAELQTFYCSLLASESRHFRDYLALAQSLSADSIDDRVAVIGEKEAELIQSTDSEFRFHSGIPAS